MACFHPLAAYQAVSLLSERGKRVISFGAKPPSYPANDIAVACGQCRGCRESRAREWAARCYHEASLHKENCFVTLTYDEEHVPFAETLVKHGTKAKPGFCLLHGKCYCFAGFMKRLRKEYRNAGVRYYHCGEYGSERKRPHYHALLFGFDFPDKVAAGEREGYPIWRSGTLESLWPFGFSEIGSCTFESAMYIARYIQKKWTGKDAIEHYLSVEEETGELHERLPEYTTMSRRPGIGKEWFEQFKSECYPADTVVVHGKVMPPPKYYDSLFEVTDSAELLEVKRRRRQKVRLEDCTPERLAVREKVLEAKLSLGGRSFEDG